MPGLMQRYRQAKVARLLIDVPLVRRFGSELRPVTRPGIYRVAQCQKCTAYHGFRPLEAARLIPKQILCACNGQVRVTPNYCKVKA